MHATSTLVAALCVAVAAAHPAPQYQYSSSQPSAISTSCTDYATTTTARPTSTTTSCTDEVASSTTQAPSYPTAPSSFREAATYSQAPPPSTYAPAPSAAPTAGAECHLLRCAMALDEPGINCVESFFTKSHTCLKGILKNVEVMPQPCADCWNKWLHVDE